MLWNGRHILNISYFYYILEVWLQKFITVVWHRHGCIYCGTIKCLVKQDTLEKQEHKQTQIITHLCVYD